MLRRTATLLVPVLLLSGCVTYEVADRGGYYEVAEGHYADSRYDRRYGERDDHGWYDDPYFYGWRDDRYDPWFGSIHYSRTWGASRWGWGGSRWHNRWGWGPSWASGPSWAWGPGWGHGGYWVQRPHHPRPTPSPVQPRPMPKPVVRSVGPEDRGPVIVGPSAGGEPLRPSGPSSRRLRLPEAIDAMPEGRPMPKPRVVDSPIADAPFDPPPREEAPRFMERRVVHPGFEEPPPRFEETPPRFEEPPPRFEEPRVEHVER